LLKKLLQQAASRPAKEIFIKPQVSGIVEKVFVLAGKMVKAGDIIAQVRIIPNMINLNEAESRLNRANIAFDNAKLDFDRNKALFDQV
jgi:HlyD family secretion protein